MRIKPLCSEILKLICLSTGISVSGVVSSTLAEDNDQPELSLKGYIEYAVKNSPGIEAAKRNSKVLKLEYQNSFTLPDPSIKAGYYGSEVETRVGPQKFRMGASQKIPWPGKLYGKHRASVYRYRSSEEKKRDVENLLISEIRKKYVQIYLIGRKLDIIRQNLELLDRFESVLTTRYETSSADKLPLIKTRVERVRVMDRIKSLETKGENLKRQLLALISYDPPLDIPYPDTLRLSEDTAGLEHALAEVKRSNPVLTGFDRKVKEAEAKVQAAKHNFGPDIMVSADYIFTDESSMNPPPDDNGKDPWIIGTSLNIPLWWGSKSREIQKVEEMRKVRIEKRRDAEKRLLAKTENLYHLRSDALRKAKLYRDVLTPHSEQSISLVEEKYKNGNASFLDYIDSWKTLLELRISYEENIAEFEILSSKIDKLVSKNFTEAQGDRAAE
ncbi:MAG: TolC family protein [Chitinivibrionales bacterium]